MSVAGQPSYLFILGLVCASLVVAGCSGAENRRPFTPREAEARLLGAFLLVISGELEAYCALSSGPACVADVTFEEPQRLPRELPTVYSWRPDSPPEADLDSFVFTLCGRDRLGDVYMTDVGIRRRGSGDFRIYQPIFWNNLTMEGPAVFAAGGAVDPTAVSNIAPGRDPAVECAEVLKLESDEGA